MRLTGTVKGKKKQIGLVKRLIKLLGGVKSQSHTHTYNISVSNLSKKVITLKGNCLCYIKY